MEQAGVGASDVRSFADDRALLREVLDRVIRAGEGQALLDAHHLAIELGERLRGGDEAAAGELAAVIADLGAAELGSLARSLTRWFQLLNLAEDNDRIRRLRQRELQMLPRPRSGSVREVVHQIASDGVDAGELAELLARAEVHLVMTAHPTEARRRTTLEKLARVFSSLRALDERRPTIDDQAVAADALTGAVQELWASDEIRAVSPTVMDEVQTGLAYLRSTIAEAVPAMYRELEAAIAEVYPGADIPVPPLLRFGTWMGGDRDGNPYVTPEVTVATLVAMRTACLGFLRDQVIELSSRVSLSSRLVGEPEAIAPLLAAGEEDFPDTAAELIGRSPEEPYRRAFGLIARRLRASLEDDERGYASPAAVVEDLRACDVALRANGGGYVADDLLRDVIRQVEVFGFHFARLDIRAHAGKHASTIQEVLAELHLESDYGALSEAERLALLEKMIEDRRPVIPMDISGFSADAQEVIRTFRVLDELRRSDHDAALQTYIISGTTGPVDLLEVLFLMKECRLSRAGGANARLRIVPLFEAGDTLAASAHTMRTVLAIPCYRRALAAVGDEQELMLGYSDSNKDVGYTASGWGIYRGQLELAEVMREAGLTWIFFHGRGGAVGRGGGPSIVAIGAQPPGTVGGRLKVTEQGEVLSDKYGVPEIAHRELELTTGAALLRGAGSGDARLSPERRQRYEPVVAEMAERSAAAYRGLVYGDPDFPRFFHEVTPIGEISRLRLGSRPAKRKQSQAIEDLRAIPWVFSWGQSRIVLPGWYGLGTALSEAQEAHGIELLQEMDREWPFFAALISNAEMACAKADLTIGRRYAELCDDSDLRIRIWSSLEAEYYRTCAQLTAVTGCERLLDREPTLRRAIDRRNPTVDPLSFIQIELLRRARAGDTDEALGRASALAINGIAGGLRNTG
ncbi:MAG: phosphoenolpyruvate carboxylase [Solirubrobacteraceae bacterium]|nr:phosphoenolpyruvate carboxylase [Solirubrobacteraceae bacterium]